MTTETILTDNQICKTLVDAGILLVPQEITGYDIVIARAIEQAVLQSQPNTGELPHLSREAVLRAMSRNYTPGKHTWDSLDSDACAKGADEIRQLRAALALQSQDREDALRYRWLRDNAQLFSHFGEEGNSGWCVMRRDSAITRVFTYNHAELDEAIDHARRIEGEVK